MSIKEYVSLFEIVQWENGVTKLPDNYKCGGAYKFLDYKNIYNKLPITDFKYELLPTINIFKSDINKYSSHKNKFACTWSSETNIDIFQASYISTDKPFILNGFSKLFIIKDKRFLAKWVVYFINGSKSIQKNRLSIAYTTRCNMSISELKRIKIPLINIEEQQSIIDIIEPKEYLFLKYNKLINIEDIKQFNKDWRYIIDIIEPFEKESEIIQSKINQLENIFNSLNMVAKEIGLMINNDVFFEKGISINSKYISNTKTDKAFLNVSAINNNINKWVNKELSIENNIRFGDVLLSLDGTIGLVNNFLSGINGYGYKVYSNSISNSQIYLSLINNFNQKIMLDGSHGSVIKHASNTRNNLILFSYGDLDIDNLYKYEISLKKQLMIVQEITKKLINYYIK